MGLLLDSICLKKKEVFNGEIFISFHLKSKVTFDHTTLEFNRDGDLQ